MELAAFFTDISIWSIIVFAVGLICIVVEVFQPGFGFFGIAGIVCFIIDVIITADTLAEGLLMSAVLFVIVALLLLLSAFLVSRGHLPKRLVLTDSTDAVSGFSGVEDMQYLIGRSGQAVTDLRPSGMADFDGVRLDVVTRGDYITKGKAIEVVAVESNRIVVKEKLEVVK